MSSRRLHLALYVAVLALLAGCTEDLTPEQQAWDGLAKGWTQKFTALKSSHEELASKVKALPATEGNEAATKAKVTLDEAVKAQETAIAELEKTLASAKASVDKAIAAGKKDPAKAVIDSASKAVSAALKNLNEKIETNLKALGDYEKALADGKAAAEKARLEAEAAKAFAALTKKKGATLDLHGIAFNGADVDAAKPESKADLDKLVALTKACPTVKVNVALTAVGPAKDLGSKRATALKAYLGTAGAPAKAVGKVSGTVSKAGTEKVSASVATPCK